MFGDIVWSPDATALLVDWPTANQWMFLRGRRCTPSRIGAEFPRADDLRPRVARRAALVLLARFARMLQAGDRVPDATIFLGPNEPLTLLDLVDDGPKLLVFYLFDWSST